MEKNMSGIQPRTLTNDELIRHSETMMCRDQGLPLNYQQELLKRFTQADVQHAPAYPQHGQLDLFK
jgi:hypothetical protein